MKKNLFLLIVFFIYISSYLGNSCKKNKEDQNDGTKGISTSFTEEFQEVFTLVDQKHWVTSIGVGPGWYQGTTETVGKGSGITYGFAAYSSTSNPTEYVGSFNDFTYNGISTWLTTPLLSVKNGDKISFYTRADTGAAYADRLQVRMNKLSTQELPQPDIESVGGFTAVLLDINSGQTSNGYPRTWTKYEYTFTGISGKIDVSIAFRYYVPVGYKAKGIGIDQFQFQVN